MSATSRTLGRTTGTGDEMRTQPSGSGLSAFYDFVATDDRAAGTLARLSLGLVMFPHATQKLFGWFGGDGLDGTYSGFTTNMGLPPIVAVSAIILETVGTLLLIVGAFTRAAAAAILAVMIGAIVTVHAGNGFLMNWSGTKGGEGFEFHLLAIGLALVTIILGGEALSVDRLLTKRLRPRVSPLAGKFMGGDGEPAPVSTATPGSVTVARTTTVE